jgi:hypothetical protein
MTDSVSFAPGYLFSFKGESRVAPAREVCVEEFLGLAWLEERRFS